MKSLALTRIKERAAAAKALHALHHAAIHDFGFNPEGMTREEIFLQMNSISNEPLEKITAKHKASKKIRFFNMIKRIFK